MPAVLLVCMYSLQCPHLFQLKEQICLPPFSAYISSFLDFTQLTKFQAIVMVGKVIDLARRVLENATKYEEYYAFNNLVAPTFDAAAFPEPVLPHDIVAARESLLDASTELQDLVRGPSEIVRNTATYVS